MVIPFTLETYGALGKSASDLLKRLVDAYLLLPNDPLSPAAFSVLIRQRVSVALQKGNALVDTQGIRLAVTASCRLMQCSFLIVVLVCSCSRVLVSPLASALLLLIVAWLTLSSVFGFIGVWMISVT